MALDDCDPSQPDSCGGAQSPSCPACSGGGRRPRWVMPVVLAAIAIMVLGSYFNSPDSEEVSGVAITWSHDYHAALEEARQQDKPVLLAFHASWCPPCKAMKQTTYRDPEVVEAAAAFVPIMIDSDAHRDLARQYDVQGLPTYVIIRPDGVRIATFAGYRPAADFVAQLDSALP